jgi:GT2 family glycosyltransferase
MTTPPDEPTIEGERPTCSIVIPSYNGKDLLRVCLESVWRCRRPGEASIEVIVADDASTDGTPEWLSREHPKVRLVRLAHNGGFCAAANAGLAAARGQFIQLLNNDTEVTTGWLEAGLAPFRDPAVGSVAPLVLVRSDPGRVDSAGDSYAMIGWPTKRGHGQPASAWIDAPALEVFGASGSSAFYRAEALARVGGFDPDYGSYYEDVDLAFRLRWAGYRCVHAPNCRILHEVSASYHHGNSALQRRLSRNAEFVFWSDLPARTLALAALPHLGFLLAQGGWRLLKGRARPFWLGKLDALRAAPRLRQKRLERASLARSAIAAPHFPVGWGAWSDVRNHLSRPREAERSRRVHQPGT